MTPLTEHELDMRQRTTRIESRLCRLANALGVQTGDPSKTMWRVAEDSPCEGVSHVATSVLDASVSDVIRFLTKEGIEAKVVCLHFEGQLIARIYPHAIGER